MNAQENLLTSLANFYTDNLDNLHIITFIHLFPIFRYLF
jgi:hypothetical protein